MQVISRNEAKSIGEKFYFTGAECAKGHLSQRYVSTSQCVSCQREHKVKATTSGKDRDYYYRNKERISEVGKVYRAKNKDKISTRKKDYAERNADRIKQYKKEYHIKNRDAIIKKVRQYYYQNKDEIAVKSKKYREKNKARKAEYDRVFSQVNKDYRNMLKAANRAKRKQRVVDWDIELTEFVAQEAFDLCDIRERLTGFKWHVDHIVPLCGKDYSGLHNAYNLQVVPADWNLSKGNRHTAQYFGYNHTPT